MGDIKAVLAKHQELRQAKRDVRLPDGTVYLEVVGELWDTLTAAQEHIEALEAKLRSELRCRGLSEAEVVSEFAALREAEDG